MSDPKVSGPTDAAALAGSAVAATIGLAVGNGPYGALSFIMSVSLLLIIFGYIWPHSRTALQSWAAAGAIAVAAIPGVAALLEILLFYLGTEAEQDGSRVSDFLVGVVWTVLFFSCAALDHKVKRTK